MFTWRVTEEEQGERADVVLVRHAEGLSRARVKEAFAQGQVRLNGRRVDKGAPVAAGDELCLTVVIESVDFSPEPNPALPLDIVFESDEIVVLNKVAGVPCQPMTAGDTTTVCNALLSRYPEMRDVGYARREPGLIHRLDNGTSGVLVAARTRPVFAALSMAMKQGLLDKRYCALVEGWLPSPVSIDAPMAPHERDPKRMRVVRDGEPGARAAHTEIVSAERFADFSLATVRAPRATRHQIRVHLADFGHPLAGDLLYGGPNVAGLSRHFLHASSIAWSGLDGVADASVEAPMSPDLLACLATLRGR